MPKKKKAKTPKKLSRKKVSKKAKAAKHAKKGAKKRVQVSAKTKPGKKAKAAKKKAAKRPVVKRKTREEMHPENLSEREVHQRLIAAGFILGKGLCSTYIEACKMAFYEKPMNDVPFAVAESIAAYPQHFPRG